MGLPGRSRHPGIQDQLTDVAGARQVACCRILWLADPLTAEAAEVSAPLERPLVTVDPQAHYRMVYDVHSGKTVAGISRGLHDARGPIEAYRKRRVKPNQLGIHLVLHGKAAKFLLVDETDQMAINDPFAVNPNANIPQNLLNLGVHVEICRSTMRSKGWTARPMCCPV
jgi:intracellular sulfur oxidation DsrE/DsrF family protein